MTTLSNIPYEELSIGQTGSGVNHWACALLLLIAAEQQRVRVLEPG